MDNLINRKIKFNPKVSLIIKDKDLEIANLKLQLQSKVHLFYSNSIMEFIDSEFLTIYSTFKLLILYYLKKFLDLKLRNTIFSADNIYKDALSKYYLGWILFIIYFSYITYKYWKNRKKELNQWK